MYHRFIHNLINISTYTMYIPSITHALLTVIYVTLPAHEGEKKEERMDLLYTYKYIYIYIKYKYIYNNYYIAIPKRTTATSMFTNDH